MQPVLLKPLLHRGGEQIAIFFAKNNDINLIVKRIEGIKWSQTHKCWYLPLNNASHEAVKEALEEKAVIDENLIEEYLQKKKQAAKTVVTASNAPASFQKNHAIAASAAWKLSKENLAALQKFVEQLKLKAYSESTIRTYRNEFLQLLQLLNKKPVDDLSPDDLRRYFIYCFEKLKLTENTLHSRINAIKFYFEQVLGKEKFFWEIPRPKKPQILPRLLNEKELANLFNALQNKKHKAMLFTAYSAGLRVSEIVNLKIADIDSKRMQIFIERAKGKKKIAM